MICELPWEWSSKEIVIIQQETKPLPPLSPSPSPSLQKPQGYFHKYIPIWTTDTDTIKCRGEDASIFWYIILQNNGGFISRSLEEVQREHCVSISQKVVDLAEQGMKMIPIGEKEMQTKYGACIRCLMSDDRIPVWNPLFMRLLIASSNYNCIYKNNKSNITIIAPWKQNKDCIIVDTSERNWEITTEKDKDVKDMYTLSTLLPKTKTERSKMSKDALYLICSMHQIYSPKWTKKSMLELISIKLTT